jgi:hypothetical protein
VNEAAVLMDREAERGNAGDAAQQSSDDRKAEETKVHGSAIAERMTKNQNVNMDALARPRRML